MMDAKGLYAGTGDGVYLLNAAQDQWKTVSPGWTKFCMPSHAPMTARSCPARPARVHSLKERTPGWTRLRQGLKDHEGLVENFIRVLAVDKEQGVYAGTFDGGVFRSGDGGKTWLPISRALPNDSIRGLISNERGVYVVHRSRYFQTVDKGRQWVPLNKGLSNLSVQVFDRRRKRRLLCRDQLRVFRSDDDGLTWTAVSQGLEGRASRHSSLTE